jgi:hypothetical protein
MPLAKYFKAGQKVSLHALPNDAPGLPFIDSLTCYLLDAGRGYLDLRLPYRVAPGEEYPFTDGMPFELFSDAMGMGIRLTGTFEKKLAASRIRIKHNSDLTMVKRRLSPRCDVNIEVGCTRSQGKLLSFRRQWEKNARALSHATDLSKMPKFPRSNVNLSANGIGMMVKLPVEPADIFMLLINLDDEKPSICALGEVVWFSKREVEGQHKTGFQFLNILESDQQRLAAYVETKNSYVPETEEEEEQ